MSFEGPGAAHYQRAYACCAHRDRIAAETQDLPAMFDSAQRVVRTNLNLFFRPGAVREFMPIAPIHEFHGGSPLFDQSKTSSRTGAGSYATTLAAPIAGKRLLLPGLSRT